jgi:hypothetical protein
MKQSKETPPIRRCVQSELRWALTECEEIEDEIDEEVGDEGCEDRTRTTYISKDEVIGLLHSIEGHRQAITDATGKFDHWVQSSEELRQVWSRFLISGGVSAEDFRQFLAGRFRHRPVRQRQHLRLIKLAQ